MKKNKFFTVILSIIITFIILFFLLYKTNYIQNEGFNPSDEGVIVAQSYRLINGEIPHKDFVAIRPVLSGLLHTIHFISPLPLVESGRWFTLFENFLIAIFCIMIFRIIFFKELNTKNSLLIFIPLSLFVFLLNVNIYTFFPWTTIDAIMFSITGLCFIVYGFRRKKTISFFHISTGLFISTLGALCRQSFILFPLFISLMIMIYFIKYKHSIIKLILINLLGYIPVMAYILYLYSNNALLLFYNQITGRTELFETGFVTFGKHLIQSYLIVFYILVAGFVLFRKFKKINPVFNAFHKRIFYGFHITITIFQGISIFFLNYSNFFKVPFELFYIVTGMSIFYFITNKTNFKKLFSIISIILISWISSISLGDNAPIFSTGLLFCLSLLIGLDAMVKLKAIYIYVFLPLAIFFIIISIIKQREINYRDLSYKELNYDLGKIHSGFGNIKTNKNTFDYYTELIKITEKFQKDKKTFVVIPNNAILYPLIDTKNLFPLDWMQRNEYIGNEEFVHNKIKEAIINDIDYIIIDKFNSKTMQNGFYAIDTTSFNYGYLSIIYELSKKINKEYKYFIITKAKKI